MSATQELWLPPLAPKDQKRVNRQRKYQRRKWLTWIGFQDKTCWDWLQLLAVLAVPIIIAGGTLWFSDAQTQTTFRIAQDQQEETVLQTYLDRMSDLLLNGHLLVSQPSDEVRQIARIRTLTILPQLNSNRKNEAIQFLLAAKLIQGSDNTSPIIDLSSADLSYIDLEKAMPINDEPNLSYAKLSDANLTGANLHISVLNYADLERANLTNANLDYADLQHAGLSNADLRGANLTGADLSYADLARTDLRGANLTKARLNYANLAGADLRGADLTGADLSLATMPDDCGC